MVAEREAFWEIYATHFWWTRLFVYALALVTMVIFTYGVWRRVRVWRAGKPEGGRFDRPRERLLGLVRYGILQAKILRESMPGWMHALIFWGFVLLFLGTSITVLDEDFYRLLTGEKFIRGGFYVGFSFILDLAGVAVLVGLAIAAYRRYKTRPARLDNRREDGVLLALIAAIIVTGFLVEGGRIAREMPPFEVYSSPVGYQIARLIARLGPTGQATFHGVLWFLHLFLGLGFIAYLPFAKGFHILTGLANVYTRNLGAPGKPVPIPDLLQRMEEGQEVALGYKTAADLTWKERLMADACVRCGRCHEVCPATATGKKWSPKEFIQAMRQAVADSPLPGRGNGDGARPLLQALDPERGLLTSAEMWDCTNCLACAQACPILIEHVPLVAQVRRQLAMELDETTPEGRKLFKNMDVNANPWGMNPADRVAWTQGLDIPTVFDKPDFEYLLWVGCLGAYDQRSQKIARAVVQVLQEAGVDFAILGEMELCCGDPIRRLGNEASFQAMVKMTADNLKEAGVSVKKVLTLCPHCMNTLAHDYKDFGLDWEVTHHSVFLAELIRQGRVRLREGEPLSGVVHDSCFLGRYNGVYEAPREIARAAGIALVEADRSRENGFCCGGGGGRTWLEEHVKTVEDKINVTRVTQLGATGAGLFLSACPYCMMMFDEGTKLKKVRKDDALWRRYHIAGTPRAAETEVDLFDLVQLKDVAELVAERMVRQTHFRQ